MWELHPTLCTNVTVRGLDISSHGPNNDGCDPESCRDVLIEDCLFDTGDDCIAIKSGRNNDGRRIGVASENIVIRHCTMKDGHGGVVIGSEVSGGCRNVYAEDCEMDSPNLDRVLRLKSNAVRGGVIENVFVRDITVGQVADAVLQVDFMYEEGPNGSHKPVARNIVMEGITVNRTPRVFNVVGFPGAEISGVRVRGSVFRDVQKPDVIKEADAKLLDCRVEASEQGSAAAANSGMSWASLFDGRTLEGWVPMNGVEAVATNKALRIIKGMGWLRSARPYTNFIFEAEWRALEPKYNSGFFVRSELGGTPWQTNVWQVNLKESALGSLMRGPATILTNSIAPVPVNEWSRFRLEASGATLRLTADGKQVWEFRGLDASAGFIGLQAEGKVMEFRNLRLQELP
jgi:hypothetical protein